MLAAYAYLDQQADYLAPAIHLQHQTCVKCRGTVTQGYTKCYRCKRVYPACAFPDALGFGIYAQAGQQSGSVMRRYKGDPPAPTHQTIVLALTMMGIQQATQRFKIDVITFVPSLGGRQGPHPLAKIIKKAASGTPQGSKVRRTLYGKSGVVSPRDYAPSNFQVRGGDVSGKAVLLIDDTWASGGHFLSATGALRQGGAQNVIGFSLARWLRDGNEYGESDIMETVLGKRESFKRYSFF